MQKRAPIHAEQSNTIKYDFVLTLPFQTVLLQKGNLKRSYKINCYKSNCFYKT